MCRAVSSKQRTIYSCENVKEETSTAAAHTWIAAKMAVAFRTKGKLIRNFVFPLITASADGILHVRRIYIHWWLYHDHDRASIYPHADIHNIVYRGCLLKYLLQALPRIIPFRCLRCHIVELSMILYVHNSSVQNWQSIFRSRVADLGTILKKKKRSIWLRVVSWMPKRPFCLGLNVLNKMFKVVSWDIAEIIHDVKYNVL